jgi:multiple sugar transport system ATP-binding protein
MASVALRDVVKDYDRLRTVHGISLDVAEGEFVVLVGPSGCGKSTTLRMIAGLEDITAGEVRIDGRTVNDVEPGQRDIAMVFQNYALYPHLSVADNITFGLKLRRVPRAEIRRRLAETAGILEIGSLLDRKPRQLSGGQRQRVAMGRAIIRNPKVFLFDEPLSNLDAKLRVQMRTEIKELHARIPTTTIYVTHDQVEAMTLADRVVVMNQGRIEQVASPQELYSTPASLFVAAFIGSPGMNFLPVTVEAAGKGLYARLGTGDVLPLADERRGAFGALAGKAATAGIRPEHFTLADDEGDLLPGQVSVTLRLVEPLGMETLVHFELAGEAVVARLPPDARLKAGARIKLRVPAEGVRLFDIETSALVG